MPGRVIGYARVSTTMQAKDGISLDAQRDRITAYAALKDMPVQIFVDAGLSGGHAENRPDLQNALSALKQGDIFCVYDVSRFARNAQDSLNMLARITKVGAEFCAIQQQVDTSTPQGKMLFGLLSVFSSFERDMVSKKVSDSMQYLSKEGRLVKKPPFGWRWVAKGKPFEPHPEQQAVIEQVRAWRALDANVGVSEITIRLNDDPKARAAQCSPGRPYHYSPVRAWMEANGIALGRLRKSRAAKA